MRVEAGRLALGYFALGTIWIVGTDWLVSRLDGSVGGLVPGPTTKGLLFVALGSVLIYIFSSRRVRERRAASEAHARLERRLAAVARFEAIGQLTGSIAHDFNNLITAITGNIAAYTSQIPDGQTPHELVEARQAADRAAELTGQLLAYGRRQVLRPERVDVNAVIRGMSALLARLIGSRVEIRMDLSEELRSVHVDPGRLEQVVMNLAINARDAMPGGGELRIRTRNVHVSRADARRFPFPFVPGDYVRLEVEDTGAGIPPEIQAHIFEPFFTTKPKGVGTGLGLSTVYGIVKQSSGYITVESVPGSGAVFSVHLPQSPDPRPVVEDPAPSPEKEEEGSGTETVLVVEDDSAVRSLVIRVLQRRGFAVLEARDGQEALDVLRQGADRIDLVVTDAVMPQLTGHQLMETAWAFAPELRVLLISGYAGSEFSGGLPYLAKPFTPAQLIRSVRAELDR